MHMRNILLAFEVVATRHNTFLTTFVKLLETVSMSFFDSAVTGLKNFLTSANRDPFMTPFR